MKYFKSILFTGIVALSFTACTDDIKPVLGTYSYKISGKATIDDTISVALDDEMGALEILRKDDDKMLLTLNTMGSDVCAASGVIDGTDITLDPFTHQISVTYKTSVLDTIVLRQADTTITERPFPFPNDTVITPARDTVLSVERPFTKSYEVTVTGTGEVYDETILFTLFYSGQGIEDTESRLVADNLTMVAKRN